LGTGCEPGATVSFALEPGAIPLGTTTADGDGNYRFTSTFPSVAPGTYTIVSTCGATRATTEVTISSPAPDQLNRTTEVTISSRAPDQLNRTSPTGGDRTLMAFTGAQVLGLVTTGAVLLTLGGVALLYGRRWHRSRA
jgi:hypothetical protein